MGSRKYAYAIVDSTNTFYAEMAAVSAYLLRKADPDANIVAFYDALHIEPKSPAYEAMLNSGVELQGVEVESEDSIYRSRWIKISLRLFLNERFLYLDTDTLPLQGISEVWREEADLCGVVDPDSGPQGSPAIDALGWQNFDTLYLNSGVLLWGDSAAARDLASSWLKLYDDGYSVGERRDQPSLFRAIQHTNAVVKCIDRKFNVMVRSFPYAVGRGCLLHTGTGYGDKSFDLVSDTVLHVATHYLKATGRLPVDLLNEFAQTGNPWTEMHSFRQAWGVRHFRRAARMICHKALLRIFGKT